ncbi:MAG TPA: c-type cytochrome domain-containing protein [Flavisolibacter sp.]|nr:c-type cytochrome domain-containing protein [Flavisolibacter sp.]
MLLSVSEFIGRFHPVLVHLPIGILLLALLLQQLSRKEKYAVAPGALKIIWLLGILSALLSCITGFLLSNNGEYDGTTVALHMWGGIAVTAVSLLVASRVFIRRYDAVYKAGSIALLILILITGHLGGTLTHGEGYLTGSLSEDKTPAPVVMPTGNVQEAMVYNDMVRPILQARCYDCHGEKKQKGKLRLDSPEALLKGGKKGELLGKGKVDESELIKRLLLPKDNDDHMPPKKKPQLTKDQIALLHWWVEQGAPFTKKVEDLQQTDKVKTFLAALQQPVASGAESNEPETSVEAADPKAIEALKSRGVVVLPIAQNSNYLSVNFVSASKISDKDLQLLLPLKKQLLILKLSDAPVTNAGLPLISNMAGLRKLYLDHTSITDEGLSSLKKLGQLQYLNLVGTQISMNGLKQLQALKELKTIYLYQTRVNASEWPALKKMFPGVLIDSGGYHVPTLQSDTTEVKSK